MTFSGPSLATGAAAKWGDSFGDGGLAMATVEARRALARAVMMSVAILIGTATAARAQDKGTLNPKPLPPLAHPDDPKTPAKELFGRRATPAPVSAVEHHGPAQAATPSA